MKIPKRNNKKNMAPARQEITVERKPVAAAIQIWHLLMMGVSGAFALVGIISLCVPALRLSIWEIFLQFAYEISIFS